MHQYNPVLWETLFWNGLLRLLMLKINFRILITPRMQGFGNLNHNRDLKWGRKKYVPISALVIEQIEEIIAYWISAIQYCTAIFTFCPGLVSSKRSSAAAEDLRLSSSTWWQAAILSWASRFQKREAKLDVYAELRSPPDLHYNNTITTGVYNRMRLLFACCRCLCVFRKWAQQHPGDLRAGGAAACVAPVITRRLPVQEGQKPSVSHPQSERGRS